MNLTLRTEETMTDGPINHIDLLEDLMDNAAAKISKMASSKETRLDQYLETANALELVGTVIDFKL